MLKGTATAVLTGNLQETAKLALAYLGKFEQLGIPLDSLSRYCMSLLGAAGSPAAGHAAARQIIAAAPNDPRGYDFLSHFRQRVGDMQGALESARAALERGPHDGGLHCRVGCVLMYHLSRPAEAEPHLRRGTELWPDPRAWFWHAEALERIGRLAEARKAIAEAVRRDPANTHYQAAATRLESG